MFTKYLVSHEYPDADRAATMVVYAESDRFCAFLVPRNEAENNGLFTEEDGCNGYNTEACKKFLHNYNAEFPSEASWDVEIFAAWSECDEFLHSSMIICYEEKE